MIRNLHHDEQKESYDLRVQGFSFSDIAKKLNISVPCAKQRWAKHARWLRNPAINENEPEIYSFFSTKVANSLCSIEMYTIEDLKKAYKNGNDFKNVINLGRVGRQEILTYLKDNP
ncbi:MAG: hypothetical protein V4570_06370 [Pseudomonadota bacterium]